MLRLRVSLACAGIGFILGIAASPVIAQKSPASATPGAPPPSSNSGRGEEAEPGKTPPGSPLLAKRPRTFDLSPAGTLVLLRHVADWQLAHPTSRQSNAWSQAVLDTGIMALAGISADPKYLNAMLAMGETNEWNPGSRVYDADGHCIGQTYAELYLRYGQDRMIAPLRERFDGILAHPADFQSLTNEPGARSGEQSRRCESLFMSSPAWARLYAATGDGRYLDFAVTHWWLISDFLYDRDSHLFFSDGTFFQKREANGKRIFSTLGNGFVLAGLTRVLQVLPNNHPDRHRFLQQFRDMADAVRACQQPDGLWRKSLLDPASHPLADTAGSALLAYALAWGCNQGILDADEFEASVSKAWLALSGCVQSDGKLACAEPAGADAEKLDAVASETCAAGAFLLAGVEMYRKSVFMRSPAVVVRVTNPSASPCRNETVELDWSKLYGRLGGARAYRPPRKPAIMDGATSRMLDCQLVPPEDGHGVEKVLFQATLAPGETRIFLAALASAFPEVPEPLAKNYAPLKDPLKVEY